MNLPSRGVVMENCNDWVCGVLCTREESKKPKKGRGIGKKVSGTNIR